MRCVVENKGHNVCVTVVVLWQQLFSRSYQRDANKGSCRIICPLITSGEKEGQIKLYAESPSDLLSVFVCACVNSSNIRD